MWRGNGRQNDARLAQTARTQSTISAIYDLIAIQILHRYSASMGLRDSISKPFKGLKRRLAKGSRKRGEGPGREPDTEEGETGQSSRLHPEAEDMMESGPSQKGNDGEGENAVQANPLSPSTDSDGKPSSERKNFFMSLPPDRFFSERSGFCNQRSCQRGPSQQERTEYRRQEQIGLEVDGVCHGRGIPPWGQRFRRCLWST